jgi:hypothetical protein
MEPRAMTPADAATAERAGGLGTALAVALVFLLANRDLVTGASVPLWDADMLYGPYQMLVADHARAGRLLSWNPWTLGGAPDFAEPQAGAFSPLAIGFGALAGGTLAGFRAYWLFVWALGGAGLLVLARHLRATPWGGFVATLGFLFSGLYLGHASHTSYLSAFAFVPWFFWRIDVAAVERRLWPAVEAGAIWGLSGLSAYPAMTLLTPCFGAMWMLGRTLFPAPGSTARRPGARDLAFVAVALAVIFVVGAVVLAPPYVGLLREAAGVTPRVGARAREIAIGDSALAPGALLTFASPGLASLKLANPGLWPYTDVTHASVSLGALVPALALLALAVARDRMRWWIAALAAAALALSLGQTLPFRGWLYDLFPPSRVFRHAGLFRNYALFFVTVLALLGSRDVTSALERADRRTLGRWLGVSAALGLAALAAYATLTTRAWAPGEHTGLGQLHLGLAWGGACAAVAAGVTGVVRARTALLALALLAAAEPFFARALSSTVATQSPGAVERWRQIDTRRSASLDLSPRGLARDLVFNDPFGLSNKNLPLKIAELEGYTSFTNPFHDAWVADGVLSAAALQPGPATRPELQRSWFAPDAPIIRPTGGGFAAFQQRANSLGRVTILRHPRDAMPGDATAPADPQELAAIGASPPAQRIGVEVVTYRPDALVLRVDAPGAGWLLVTDRWAPSWRARVDGVDTEVWPADFLFRAVPVHAGSHEVAFDYRPFGLPWLALSSVSVLAAVALGSVARAFRGPRGSGVPGTRSASSAVA